MGFTDGEALDCGSWASALTEGVKPIPKSPRKLSLQQLVEPLSQQNGSARTPAALEV